MNKNPIEALVVSVTVIYTFINDILNDNHVETEEDSSDEEPIASQVDDGNDVVNNDVDMPNSKKEKI